MARYTFSVEIAGVETLEADAFATKLRAMAEVVCVEVTDDGGDVPLFPPLEVFHKEFNSVWKGWAICTRDPSEDDERRATTPFMRDDGDWKRYEYYVNECGGKLDPTKLRRDDLDEYVQACYYWARLCMSVTGCNEKGLYKTREDAEEVLPLLNWAVRNPGKEISVFRRANSLPQGGVDKSSEV